MTAARRMLWLELDVWPRLWWVDVPSESAHVAFQQYVMDLMDEHGSEKGTRLIEIASARLAEEGGGSLQQWVEAIEWAIISFEDKQSRPN